MGAEKGGKAWVSAHAALRSEHGIGEDWPKWSSRKELWGIPQTARVKDVIDVSVQIYMTHLLAKRQKETTKKLTVKDLKDEEWMACPWYIDISQNASRKPFSNHLRSMVANSCFYSCLKDRVVLPVEHLLVLGWPSNVVTASLSANSIRELAGESMACPAVGLCMLAMGLALPDTTLWERPVCIE